MSFEPSQPGALILSLDFELHWGVRDHCAPDGPYRSNLLGARKAIPRMLALFEAYGVAATWATVGFLFARSRTELACFCPDARPQYENPLLRPYTEPLGQDERSDPLHYAWSLIERIAATPRQEIGSHTFSHYYCLEPGQDAAAFAADLRSAAAIAQERGIRLRSLVLPRNQWNPAYAGLVRQAGFAAYRGPARGWIHRARPKDEVWSVRAPRLLDSYVNLSGSQITRWSEIEQENGLVNLPASQFLRPWSPAWAGLDRLRFDRIAAAMNRAARQGGLFHLWWHPHNFGAHLEQNLAFLERILEHFQKLAENAGMLSLSMAETAERAAGVPAQALRQAG